MTLKPSHSTACDARLLLIGCDKGSHWEGPGTREPDRGQVDIVKGSRSFLALFLTVHVCLRPCIVTACECGCLQRSGALALLGAEPNGDCAPLPWLLGTGLGFSAKAACASNCGATSQPPGNYSCSVEQGTRAGANKGLAPD